MIVDKKKDAILGVHIIGSNASELIQQAIIAIKTELSAEKLGSLIFSHPTQSEAIKETASLINSKAIHISNRKRKEMNLHEYQSKELFRNMKYLFL